MKESRAMVIQPQNATRLVQLLVWIGGVASTVAGAWVTSKIRVYHDARKAHHEDLKLQVLSPIREELADIFGPSVTGQAPLLSVEWARVEFDEHAKASEEPSFEGEVLVAPFPTAKVFGQIHSALLEDAQKNHFAELMKRVDAFLLRWSQHLGLWHAWCADVSRRILAASGLESYPSRTPTQSYVMDRRLALFVYYRLAGFATSRMTIQPQGATTFTLAGMDRHMALGSREQVDALLAFVDKLLETERSRTTELRSKGAGFQEEFGKICSALDYAIASRRPRGRCDLVTFF